MGSSQNLIPDPQFPYIRPSDSSRSLLSPPMAKTKYSPNCSFESHDVWRYFKRPEATLLLDAIQSYHANPEKKFQAEYPPERLAELLNGAIDLLVRPSSSRRFILLSDLSPAHPVLAVRAVFFVFDPRRAHRSLLF